MVVASWVTSLVRLPFYPQNDESAPSLEALHIPLFLKPNLVLKSRIICSGFTALKGSASRYNLSAVNNYDEN